MKHFPVLLLSMAGIALGWILGAPAEPTYSDSNSITKSNRKPLTSSPLLKELLGEFEYGEVRRGQARSAAQLAAEIKTDFNSFDVERLLELGAGAALDELLPDPGAWLELCTNLAREWSHREPEKALRYFMNKSSFRAQDCLAEVIPAAFGANPELATTAIRSMSRTWLRRHLEDLVTSSYWVKNPDPKFPPPATDDPFAPDDRWIEKPVGEGIIEALEDPVLQDLARKYLAENSEESGLNDDPTEPTESRSLKEIVSNYQDPALFDSSKLAEHFRHDREGTMTAIVEHGNYRARQYAMGTIIADFPMEEAQWPEALENLERQMADLQVIPTNQPHNYHVGRFLHGEVVAEWIERQPLALQRSWIPGFVQTWAERDVAGALDWALTLAESPHRHLAIQQGLVIWAHEYPAEAQQFVENLPPGDLRESSISNAAASWSRVDPEAARDWLNTLPETPARQRALERTR